MKVLVTGASGFLGSHVVDRCFALGYQVRVLVRPSSDLSHLRRLPGIDLAVGDLETEDTAERATRGVQIVYHAAARVTDLGSRRQFYAANVHATRNLLSASRGNGVERFVFVSSPSVVADGKPHVDIDERYPYPRRHLNLYCETKAAAEKLVLGENGRGIATCAIRPRAVWGPRDRMGPLPRLLAKLIEGKLPDLSGGRAVRAAICYCENAAAAIVAAGTAPRVGGHAYFVTDREQTDVWAFIAQLATAFSAPPPRRRLSPRLASAIATVVDWIWKLPYLARRVAPPISRYGVSLLTLTSTYDLTAAERDLGYVPIVDRDTGMRRLHSWVNEIGGVRELVRPLLGSRGSDHA